MAGAQVQSRSEWPLVLIRIYIASGYFSSGMCKLLCGLRFNRYWGWGPTLQMYIFDSMWSRPAGPRVRALQHALLRSPRLLTLLATGAVAFETGFILAPTSDVLCVVFGLNGLLFHLSIGVLQGLDFVTFWAPALLAFLVGVPSREPWTAIFTGLETEAGFFLPAVVYVLLQVCAARTPRARRAHAARTPRAPAPPRHRRAPPPRAAPRAHSAMWRGVWRAGAHRADAARLLARGHPPVQLLPDVHAAA